MRISVLTASYNSRAFIDRLHRSLCRQTYRNFEWVIVDDRSTDASVAHLQQLSRGQPGMKLSAAAE